MYRIYDDDYSQTPFPNLDSDGKIELYWDHPNFPNQWCARHGPWPYEEDNWGPLQLFSPSSTIDVWSPFVILKMHFGLHGKKLNIPDSAILKMNPNEIRALKEDIYNGDYVAITFIDGLAKLVSLSPDGSYRYLDSCGNYHNIIYTFSVESVRWEKAIREFESMLNDEASKENDYQQFFEEYPEFILDENYKTAHAQILLERKTDGPLIPDFLLEPANDNDFCDILEIKRPSSKVFVLKKNRGRLSAAVMEGIAQLREYSDYFDNEAFRAKVESSYGLSCYKPKLFLIVGRTGNFNAYLRRKLTSAIPEVTIKTYDELLDRMKNKVKGKKRG